MKYNGTLTKLLRLRGRRYLKLLGKMLIVPE